MRSIRTTVAVGDESARNPRISINPSRAASGATRRATHHVVTPLRGFFVLSSCPWVPRGLVTHGYCCFGATRLAQHTVGLFRKDGSSSKFQPGEAGTKGAESLDSNHSASDLIPFPKSTVSIPKFRTARRICAQDATNFRTDCPIAKFRLSDRNVCWIRPATPRAVAATQNPDCRRRNWRPGLGHRVAAERIDGGHLGKSPGASGDRSRAASHAKRCLDSPTTRLVRSDVQSGTRGQPMGDPRSPRQTAANLSSERGLAFDQRHAFRIPTDPPRRAVSRCRASGS